MTGPELPEPNYDLIAWRHTSNIVKAMLRTSLVDPTAVTSIEADPMHYAWVTHLQVDAEHVSRAERYVERGSVLALAMDFYRSQIIGHWILTGINEDYKLASRLDDRETAEVCMELCEAKLEREYGYGDY